MVEAFRVERLLEERRHEPFSVSVDAHPHRHWRRRWQPTWRHATSTSSTSVRKPPPAGPITAPAGWRPRPVDGFHRPSSGRAKCQVHIGPWALHPYRYVDQNPIVYWDPDGNHPDATWEDVVELVEWKPFFGPLASAGCEASRLSVPRRAGYGSVPRYQRRRPRQGNAAARLSVHLRCTYRGERRDRHRPVVREQRALDDIEAATGQRPGYTPYDR